MQSCNIATGAICNYTNTIASIPTSEISHSRLVTLVIADTTCAAAALEATQ